MSDPNGPYPPPGPGPYPNPYGATPPPASPPSSPYGAFPAPSSPSPYGGAPAPGPVEVGPRPATLTAVVIGMAVGAALVVVNLVMVLLNLDEVSGAFGSPSTETGSADAAQTAGAVVGALLVSLVTLGLWIWMAISAGLAIGWARILATVFGGIAILMHAISLVGDLAILGGATSTGVSTSYVTNETIVNALRLLVAIVLLVLLWLPATSAYYRVRAAAKRHAGLQAWG